MPRQPHSESMTWQSLAFAHFLQDGSKLGGAPMSLAKAAVEKRLKVKRTMIFFMESILGALRPNGKRSHVGK